MPKLKGRAVHKGIFIVLVLTALFVAGFVYAQGTVTITKKLGPFPAGGSADDPAIWIHPTDSSKSLMFLSDKSAGIYVRDFSGKECQHINFNTALNNIDTRTGFNLGGQQIDIVAANLRDIGKLAVLKINPNHNCNNDVLTVLAGPSSSGNSIQGDSYGFTLYKRLSDGKMYVFEKPKSSTPIKQYLVDGNSGSIVVTAVRTINDVAIGVAEGAVADDELGLVYFAEETKGIHKYNADPDSSVKTRLSFFASGDGTASDREGLSMYKCNDGTGYLILSSQGNSQFKVYERQGNNVFKKTFLASGSSGTDGQDSISSTAPGFPNGFLVIHDGGNNYNVFDWADVAQSDLKICPNGGSGTITAQCSDGIDNDGDGKIDYPADPGCTSSSDTSEVDPAPGDTTPPVRSGGSPSGTLPSGTPSATLSLTTNEAATCKYSTTANVAYSSMTNTFTTTGGTTHSRSITGLANGNTYSYYVRCVDSGGNVNTNDFTISFSVGGSGLPPPPPELPPPLGGDMTPPFVTITAPTQNQEFPSGTASITLSAKTNEPATCRYSTTANVAYSSMTNTFTTTGGTSHSRDFAGLGLANGNNYSYYVRCIDSVGNVNTNDYTVTFSVSSAIQVCVLNSASWSKKNAVEGEIVYLNVFGNNCNGKTISFEVRERDIFGDIDVIGDDPVQINPFNVLFNGDSASGTWTAEWQSDGLFDLGGNPEYYFIASLCASSTCASYVNEEIRSGTEDSELLRVSGGACTDTTWIPSETNLCGNVTQVSNCGNARIVQGLVICNTGQICSNNNLCTTPGANDTTPPIVTITAPANNQEFPLGTTTATLSATTNEAATCRYSDADVSYNAMPYTLNGQGTMSHTIVIPNLQNGTNYVRYVRCKDTAGNTMNNSQSVRFSVGRPISFCGDNVCNATETRNSCSVDCPLSCDLTSASWSKKDAIEGEIVYLNVRGNSCDLKTISLEVKERDIFGDDAVQVNPSNVIFSGNSIQGTWTAEWQDEETGESAPPEYYFIASVVGTNEEISSGKGNSELLSVNKPSSGGGGGGYGGGGGGSGGGGGGGSGGGGRRTIHISRDFSLETGVKQIEIDVIDEAYVDEAESISITVSKYDSLPATLSVAKTGQVYKYLQVETENLGSDLENAKITFQVEKSWQIENNLGKEDVALFKFDGSLGRWNELQTTFSSEDGTYYYYEAELASFSYFAIGKKEMATEDEEIPVIPRKSTNVPVILIILVVVLLISIILIRFIKKRVEKYEDNQP